MADFFELDFLDVKSARSGDAITIRYEIGGQTTLQVVDGGFQATGECVVSHISKYYSSTAAIDHVVVTHPDGDHAGGLRSVLEDKTVNALWMLRPWEYADELIGRFARFTNVDNLKKRLREIYPNLDALEEIAIEKGIPIYEPFQGAEIGQFTVLSPTKEHYLDMVVESDKTPEIAKIEEEARSQESGLFKSLVNFMKGLWGDENFSSDETSAENEMSVVQYAYLNSQRVLLTGDAGRTGMTIAADYLEASGISLPGIAKFQVPHHGSRRNMSSELMDRWLGPKLGGKPDNGSFTAIVSASKDDDDHPRKAVVRACWHRGANVVTTQGKTLCCSGGSAPEREGWTTAKTLPYPDDQEE